MAVSAATVWEVRTTGAATNGGGFKAGASGTDWSQQDAAQYSVTDGVTDGSSTITSATANFGTDVVGNIIYVQGGTGSITAGWYEITARNSASSITVDRSTGLTAGTGVTLKIGGALSTIALAAAAMSKSNWIFVKAGSGYTTTATITLGVTGATPSATEPPNRLTGYTTTRGDGGRATITLSTNTGLTALSATNGGWYIENFAIDCASLGTSNGIVLGGNGCTVRNVKVSNFTVRGINASGVAALIMDNEVTGGTAAATVAILGGFSSTIVRNWVHDNACSGINTNDTRNTSFNLVTNNTGATSDGIQGGMPQASVEHNTIYGSGRHGINNQSTRFDATMIRNNILSNNGGYGIVGASSSGVPAIPAYDGNAFYSNTSGTRSNIDSTSGIYAAAPYTNVLDVVITDGSPFTNAAGGDFTLNNTASRGALLRGTGTPGAIPGVAQVGYIDFGCFQHQDAGSATPYVIGS